MITISSRLRSRFNRLNNRILLLLGTTLFVGAFVLVFFLTQHMRQIVFSQGERGIMDLIEAADRGLQTIMLAGDGDMAQEYVKNLRQVPHVQEFTVLRTTGSIAFRDHETIRAVNQQIGMDRFSFRALQNQPVPDGSAVDPELLDRVIRSRAPVTHYRTTASGHQELTMLMPILNREECQGCHGSDAALRGLIKVSISMADIERQITRAQYAAWLAVTGITSVILGVIYVFMRQTVVRPVEVMSGAMLEIAHGQLDRQLVPTGSHEFICMAENFNRMSRELLRSYQGLTSERRKLETIILSARDGIVATDHTGEIVLINPAAERLLGKTAAQLRADDFSMLVDDPEYINALLADGLDRSVPEIIFYKGRILNMYAAMIRDATGWPLGCAALVRDVTDEKHLEQQLRELSNTDGLTRLNNRRRFDAMIAEEFDRAKRYRLELTVMIFDVDHFKKFNDEYGHDQGDRVLQAIGAQMLELFRTVDLPCRYGGEEFIVIMPNTGWSGAMLVAERLRKRIESMVVDDLRVTISIGVAAFPHVQADTPAALVKAADTALYQAKREGRNRVCAAGICQQST